MGPTRSLRKTGNRVIALIAVMILIGIVSFGSIPVHAQQNVLRVNVAPMYIENTSIYVEIEGIFAVNNIPQSAALTYHLSIYSDNGSKVEGGTVTAPNGEILNYYLNGIQQGYYYLQVYFTTNGENCSPITTYFLVSPAPVPYTALFLSNGEFIFHSDMLNTTGKANQSYPFQVTISYQFPGGSSQTVGAFNTTNMTFKPASEGETVVVNVMDKWGWLDSAGVNIQQDVFTGPPLIYTFGNVPNPYGSVWYDNVVGDVLIIMVLLGTIYYFVRRSSNRRVIEDVYE